MATSFSGDKPHYTLGGIVRRTGDGVPVSVSGREVARMSAGQPRSPARPRGGDAREPRGLLPPWGAVLAVLAHPDDESFGLGAIIDRMTSGGAAVHVLCYTRGEASTLNQTGADLTRQRARELRQAGAALGVSTVALLDYPDGRLAGVPTVELAAHVTGLAARYHPGGLLVFDDTGITGHPDHRAATQAAVRAAGLLSLPVLAWALLRRNRRPPGGRDRPAVRRPGARAAGLRHPGQPDPAAPGRAAACQPGLARSAALAAAGAAGRHRAPALARAAVGRRGLTAADPAGGTYEGPGHGGRPA